VKKKKKYFLDKEIRKRTEIKKITMASKYLN